MAIRSLLLSFALTCLLGYALTFGLTDPHSWVKRLPDWSAIPLLAAGGIAYLLAAWWACRGFRMHKAAALVSLAFCALGLSVYALGITLEAGKGKPTNGQYDHDFSKLDPAEKAALTQLVQAAGSDLQTAVFTEHWHVAEPNGGGGFRICVQKGRVTALNLSDHPIQDLQPLSQLPALSDLYLRHCGLADLSGLRSTSLDRLDVSDNQITDLRTLAGCPNVQWLFVKNNRLKSTAGVEQFRQIVSQDFSGNPLP